MPIRNRTFTFAAVVQLAALGACGSSATEVEAPRPAPYAELEATRGRDRPSLVLTADELIELRRLFAATLASPDPAALVAAWSGHGFVLDPGPPVDGATSRTWRLREAAGERRGRGFYLLRFGEARDEMIQAPHGTPSDDRMTAELVFELFQRRGSRAAAWSTVPREETDLAHVDGTLFQQLTLAFAERWPAAPIVQLHGFSQAKRKTEAGRSADAIVSNGTAEPDDLRTRAACLEEVLAIRAATYPDVRELGATTNTQGRALRGAGVGRFIHLELSYPLRGRLLANTDEIERVGRCILGDGR